MLEVSISALTLPLQRRSLLALLASCLLPSITRAEVDHATNEAYDPNEYLDRADEFLREGRFPDAIAMYRAGLELFPEEKTYHLAIGSANEQYAVELGQGGDAQNLAVARQLMLDAHKAYRDALQLDPADAVAYYQLASSLRAAGIGKYSEVKELLSNAVELDPKHAGTLSTLAYMLIAKTGSEKADVQDRQRGLSMLSRAVNAKLWPRNSQTWQHPLEFLEGVPTPPVPAVYPREPLACLLGPLERAAKSIGREAAALLPHFGFQHEGIQVPYGGWRDYEIWNRCALGQNQRANAPNPKPGLSATCAALKEVSETTGALIHFAMFSAISPGTRVNPHCGPNNGRMILHLGVHVPKPGARLRLGRPSALDTSEIAKLKNLGLPEQDAEEVEWAEGNAFVWDDSTSHEVVWHNDTGTCDSAELLEPEDGETFAKSEPRIILLIGFFHPVIVGTPVCASHDSFFNAGGGTTAA